MKWFPIFLIWAWSAPAAVGASYERFPSTLCGIEIGLYDEGTRVPVRQLSEPAVTAFLKRTFGLQGDSLKDPFATLERLFLVVPPRQQLVASLMERLDGNRWNRLAVASAAGLPRRLVRVFHERAIGRMRAGLFHVLFEPPQPPPLGLSVLSLGCSEPGEMALLVAGYVFVDDVARASEGEISAIRRVHAVTNGGSKRRPWRSRA